jgi:hypothetical protein
MRRLPLGLLVVASLVSAGLTFSAPADAAELCVLGAVCANADACGLGACAGASGPVGGASAAEQCASVQYPSCASTVSVLGSSHAAAQDCRGAGSPYPANGPFHLIVPDISVPIPSGGYDLMVYCTVSVEGLTLLTPGLLVRSTPATGSLLFGMYYYVPDTGCIGVILNYPTYVPVCWDNPVY